MKKKNINPWKRESIDFLFLLEVNSREESSVILLTEELKRRGYSAQYCLFGEWGNRRYRRQPKVLVVNSCFGRQAIEHTVYTIAGKMSKVVTMRWEQIGTKKDSKGNYEKEQISETAKTFNTFAWGNEYFERMLRIGMKKIYIHMVGPVFMDFFRPEFREVFIPAQKIKKQYGIPTDKKFYYIYQISQ